jgi:glyoxylase-like metal-dependent hydrolase (beta-lactamase superfamily II)
MRLTAGGIDHSTAEVERFAKLVDVTCGEEIASLSDFVADKVDRVLNEGDEIAGFKVVHAPGHARGEVIFFRESDGVAICGDVIRNMSYATTLAGLREPPDDFTYDPVENRRSIRKLAALKPNLILPGHGPEVTDMAAFQRWAEALPTD